MGRRIDVVGSLTLCLISSLVLPAQTPATPCKSTVTGTLEVIPLKSDVYGGKRTLRVWLPTAYSASSNSARRYPVLYIFDGQDLFDRCTSRPGQDEWHVDETLTDLIAKRAVEPVIVVGIDNAGPGHREDEYSRYGAMADATAEAVFVYDTGSLAAYRRALQDYWRPNPSRRGRCIVRFHRRVKSSSRSARDIRPWIA